MEPVSKIIDVLFNGRPAQPERTRPTVTIDEMVKRGKSCILWKGKLYRVTFEQIDEASLKTKGGSSR